MEVNKFNCSFGIREQNEVLADVCGILNKTKFYGIDKNKIIEKLGIYKIDNNLNTMTSAVQEVCEKEKCNIIGKCKLLEEKWKTYGNEIFKNLNSRLDLLNNEFQYSCLLHTLPINAIDYDNFAIHLDYNKDIDELFITSIIMVSKLALLQKYIQLQHYKFDTQFTNQNKVWMFIEIAIDAIFANCDLNKFCKYPSYKYFYSLKINNVNIMEKFRELYKHISLNDFLDSMYKFVRQNYDSISKFRNYLY